MKQRPKEFGILALVLLGVALSFPLQVVFMMEEDSFDLISSFYRLAPLNWAVIVLCILNAAILIKASQWVLVVAPALIFMVIWNNWLVAETGLNAAAPLAWIATGLMVTVHCILLRSAPRKVLTHPGLKWWKTPKRHAVRLNALMRPVSGYEVMCSTVNISEGGAFLELADSSSKLTDHQWRKWANEGSRCNIRIPIGQARTINCQARLVRYVERPAGRQPLGGVGLKFLDMGRAERKQLQYFLKEREAVHSF